VRLLSFAPLLTILSVGCRSLISLDVIEVTEQIEVQRSVRKRGLKYMGLGLMISLPLWGLVVWLVAKGFTFHFALVPACLPFAYVCMGLVELVSGRPFQQLGRAWMDLKGWQRGVLGTFIILVAIAVMICAVALIGSLL